MLPMIASAPPGAFLAVAWLVIVVIVVIGATLERGGHESRLRDVGPRIGATLCPATDPDRSSMVVDVQGNPGRISYSRHPQDYSRLSLKVRRCCGGTLSIVSRRQDGAIQNLFGSTPVATGDGDFDRDFVVHAAPQKYARWLFAPSRRSDVVATLRRLALYGDVSVRISVGEVDVKVAGQLTRESDVKLLLRAGGELVGYATTTPLAGEPAPLSGICPVCATPLSEPAWRCDRCRVPHHRECRDYIGRCAIYGCEPQPRRRAA
jgi:hypothetical protein